MKETLEMLSSLVEGLTQEEKLTLINQIKNGSPIDKSIDSIRFKDEKVCVKCGCLNIIKAGKVHRWHTIKHQDGSTEKVYVGSNQRYFCRDCGKTFTSTAKTVFYRSHLSPWKIRTYLTSMVHKDSIKYASDKAGIGTKTGFRWRHKILDTMMKDSDSVILSGVIQADETDIPLSFKGNIKNHIEFHGGTHDSLMKFYNRNPLEKPLGHEAQVSVCCALDTSRAVISRPTNIDKTNSKDILRAFSNHIQPSSILCTDKTRIYNKLALDLNLPMMQFKSDDYRAKSGSFNIQQVNVYHSMLKDWLHGFKGVATKYLPNYLNWFNFVFYRSILTNDKDLLEYLAKTISDELTTKVQERAPIPAYIRQKRWHRRIDQI